MRRSASNEIACIERKLMEGGPYVQRFSIEYNTTTKHWTASAICQHSGVQYAHAAAKLQAWRALAKKLGIEI